MPAARTLGDLSPQETIHDEPGEAKRLEERVSEAQQDAGGKESKNVRRAKLRSQVEAFEVQVSGMIRGSVDEMQQARDGEGLRGGLFAQYAREEQKYRNEEMAALDELGQLSPADEFSHLKAGVQSGLFADNVNTVAAWLIQSVLGHGGRPYQLRAKGKKSENDVKTRVVLDLLDSLLTKAGLRARLAEAIPDLPKHGNCIIRQSWIERAQWVRTDSRAWEERIVERGPCLQWWRLIDVFVTNPLSVQASEQDGVVWYSRTTLSHLRANERVFEIEKKSVPDPAQPGQYIPLTLAHERGRFINLDRLREAGLNNFREQALDSGGPTNTSAEENNGGQVSAEGLLDLYEFQGWFPMGQLYRDGILTDAVLDYYQIPLLCQQQGVKGGKKPKGEALARLLDGIMWYLSMADSQSGAGGGIMVELRPCPYREPRNELIAGYFIAAGHEFYGMSSDKLAGDVGDTADQVLNDITAIITNNANPNTALARGAVGDDGGKPMTDEKLRELINGTGEIIPFNGAVMDVDKAIKSLLKPYDPSMPTFFNMLGEIYNKRTLSSNLAQGGMAQTESDTLGEAQSQLQGVERRLAEVAMRLSGESLVRPIVENVLKDLDWFYTAEELADEARRIGGETGLDWETIQPTAQEEGSGARHPLADDFIVEGTATAEIQKEVAIQFILRMMPVTAQMPTANQQAMAETCFDLMGIDPSKYFKDGKGPLPPRKVLAMILAGDRPEPDPQMDAMSALQEFNMQMAMLEQMRQQAADQGDNTEAVDGWIKVLQAYILDVTDLARVQAQAMMQAQQQAQQAAAMMRGKGPGSNAPQGPAGVMQGINQGAGRMAAQPPAGSMGPRA